MDFKFLYEVLPLTGNIDTRFFDEVDGGYKCKPILLKTIADDAVNYFKELIFKLDTENEFSSVKTRIVEDEEATKEVKAKFKTEYDELNRRWEEYRAKVLEDDNQKEFYLEFAADGSLKAEAHKILVQFSPELSQCSLHGAVAAYKAAKELSSKWGKGGDEYENLPHYSKFTSSEDYIDKHNALRKKWREELGLPEKDSDLVIKVERDVRSLKRSDSKIMVAVSPEYDLVEEFAQQVIEQLANG